MAEWAPLAARPAGLRSPEFSPNSSALQVLAALVAAQDRVALCAIITDVGDVVVSMLDRPVYSFAETDRLLRLTPGTARRWIDGYERAGREYPPVVRRERSGSSWVTWGEFVEARLLSEFRSSIPLTKLRPVVDWCREHFDPDYPLAYARPFLHPAGREMLAAAQRVTDLDEELWMVVPSGQGVLLAPTSTRFTTAAGYQGTEGPAEYLIADSATPEVWFHPGRRQGQPTVHGIRTETIAELVAAGEPMEFVAATYGFELSEIEQAVVYEASRRRAA